MVKKQTESPDKNRKFIDSVMKKLKKGVEAEKHNVDQSKEDLEFLNGDQWPQDEKDRRKRRKRTMLTINMLPDKVDKVTGDMRMNRARVKIRPASSNADSNIARIREGIIRRVEYISNAPYVFGYAGERMVECGEGAWRVLTRWCKDNPFVQEIYIELIKNSFLVIIDPEAKGLFKEDAKWAFILSKISVEDFKEQYSDKKLPSDSLRVGSGLGKELWYDGETVTIAEYMEVKMVQKTMVLMEDGLVIEKKEAEEKIKEWKKLWVVKEEKPGVVPELSIAQNITTNTPTSAPIPMMAATSSQQASPQALPMMGMGGMGAVQPSIVVGGPKPGAPPKPVILKEKEVDSPRVKWWKMTACDILEGPKDIPGSYIPVIKVTGKERNIEGKDYRRGLIRDGKDPQRLVNYWNTSAAETIALAPKAPWIGTAKQFENYEGDYAASNTENFPFLKYNIDKDAPGPPIRTRPQEPPVAIFTQISIAERNLNTVIGNGMDFRDVAPDASAKSLQQRMKPQELSTYTFVDNLAMGQMITYKIINDMIPEVYDTERDVVIRMEDETETHVPINMRADDALRAMLDNPERYKGMKVARLKKEILSKGGRSRFNDIGIGTYELVVDIGPSFSTQRAESADKFIMLAQTNPKLWGIAGDLIVQSLDVNGADTLAERLRKMLPPGLVKPKDGESPSQMPPSPQQQLLVNKAKTELIKQQKETMKVQVELVRQKTELIKQYNEAKGGDMQIRNEILKVLSELHAPNHPADENIPMLMGNGIEEEG